MKSALLGLAILSCLPALASDKAEDRKCEMITTRIKALRRLLW